MVINSLVQLQDLLQLHPLLPTGLHPLTILVKDTGGNMRTTIHCLFVEYMQQILVCNSLVPSIVLYFAWHHGRFCLHRTRVLYVILTSRYQVECKIVHIFQVAGRLMNGGRNYGSVRRVNNSSDRLQRKLLSRKGNSSLVWVTPQSFQSIVIFGEPEFSTTGH